MASSLAALKDHSLPLTNLNTQRIHFKIERVDCPALIIIGPPGVGKTAVGKQLAKDLYRPFFDTDALITEALSMSVSEIFASCGEQRFRELEHDLLKYLLKIQACCNSPQLKAGSIISCGGGLPVPEKNFTILEQLGKIIFLNAPAEVIANRIKDSGDRPLLKSKDKLISSIENLMLTRESVYQKARYQVNTASYSVAEVSRAIQQLLN